MVYAVPMSKGIDTSRRQAAALKQADRDLEAVLELPAGRRLLMRLIDQTGVFTRSFTGNSETFHREGRRSVGLDLVENIERVSPGAFSALQREALTLREQLDSFGQAGEDSDED